MTNGCFFVFLSLNLIHDLWSYTQSLNCFVLKCVNIFLFIYLLNKTSSRRRTLTVVCILWAPIHLIFVTTLWSGSCLCPLFPPPHTILRWGNQVEKKKFRTLIKVTQLVCGEVRIQTSSQATKPQQLWSWYQVLFVFVCGCFKNAHWIFPIFFFFFSDIYLFDCTGS